TAGTARVGGLFFSSRRRHTRFDCDWSSDVCSSDLNENGLTVVNGKIQIPDLRLEYEDHDDNPAKVDLELATGHYRHGSLAAKSRSEERRVGKECRLRGTR